MFTWGFGSDLLMNAKFGDQARELERKFYGEQYAYQVKS
jgi:hypothetical protein